MKRLLITALLTLCFFIGSVSVNAISEQDLREVLSKTYTINGEQFRISDEDKILLERYLNQYDISDADASYIANKVDDVIAVIEASGVKNINDLSVDSKKQIKNIINNISVNTSVKATVLNGNIVIYNPEGTEVFAEVTDLVKQTGSNDASMNVVVGISFAIVLAFSIVVLRKNILNEK